MTELILAGNPNCGKTTLFNALTGAKNKTANWPGVSVERAVGRLSLPGLPDAAVIDLPGLYGAGGGLDERLAEEYIASRRDAVVLCIADACAPVRGMALACRVGRGRRTLLVFNFADEARRRGRLPDCAAVERTLGIPAVCVSARRREGIGEMARCALSLAVPCRPRAPEGEEQLLAFCAAAAGSCAAGRSSPAEDRLDAILTHPAVGIPALLALLGAIYFVSFSVGGALGDGIGAAFGTLSAALRFRLAGANAAAVSLLCDGMLPGAAAALSFLPTVTLLFFLLAVLEDSGYMPRAALAAQPLLAPCGLPGRAVIPMLLGFGCAVPAVMAARTMEEHGARVRLISAVPLLPCSARLPLYVMLCGAFFAHPALALLGVYALSAVFALALLLVTRRGGESGAYWIELPPYRLPDARAVFGAAAGRAAECVARAGTVVLASSLLLWFLSHFGAAGWCAPQESFAARAGDALVPLLSPAGLGFAPIAAALLAGVAAKENIVAALAVLLGGIPCSAIPAALGAMGFSRANALSLLVFASLYTPCAATLSAIRRESGSRRRAVLAAFGQSALAYLCACVTFSLFGG